MNSIKKILSFIKKPPYLFMAIIYILTIGFITLSILTVSNILKLNDSISFLQYIFYGSAAILLGYSVYLLIALTPYAKQDFIAMLKRYEFTDKMVEQISFRTVIFTIVSFIINIAYVCFNCFIAISSLSIWYGALTIYYLLLVIMKGSVLIFYKNKEKKEGLVDKKELKLKEIRIYRNCGIGLIVLPIALSVAIAEMVLGNNSFSHPGLMIYVSAAYAFYKIIAAIINVVKARKNDELTIRAIRNINFASALVSILALQTAMFKEFNNGKQEGLFNAITGAFVCAFTVIVGIIVLIKSHKEKKELKMEEIEYEG